MIKYLLLATTLIYSGMAEGHKSDISSISPHIKKRMIRGNSWKQGCPTGLKDLRYVRVSHWNFKDSNAMGELIVHADAAISVTKIFEELYDIGYPVKQMRLVSNFKGSDWQSIEADNTSALNCRPVTGNSKKWSNHAYGKAIDINPIENPYISRTGYISHKASAIYRKRIHNPSRGLTDKAMLLKKDKATQIFEKYGWKWGGDWEPVKDYQHFEYVK